jgi:D-alanyl-D-alanine carboxypeptidase/D-alanyl-D-alanine-endopeptidase (penicillin-binding protein 4)
MNLNLITQSYKTIAGIIFACCSVGYTAPAAAYKSLTILEHMPNASLAIAGDSIHSLREDKLMVPASTLKVFTALLAFKTWSPDHRFATDFYVDEKNILWVKGFGDPFISSEEMGRIAKNLKERGLSHVSGIVVDDHYFAPNIVIDGKSNTLKPYDAPVGALSVNFNTLSIIRNKAEIYSGEAHTPLTPLMQKIGKRFPNGHYEINLGKQINSSRYFAEVLRGKLQQQGVKTANLIAAGHLTASVPPFYHHQNSHSLSQIVEEMLENSNNFTANQLFLMMGAERYGAPATIDKSQKAAAEKVKLLFGWNQKIFYEGSGLSYKNHLTANQFLHVLQEFAPYKSLLKSQGGSILAKTGTLTGVSSYAGYLHKAQHWVPFALFINQPVQGNFRKQLAQELLNLRS